MGNLTYQQVTKNLFTAVLIAAIAGILGGICGAFGILVPIFAILALVVGLVGIGANIWFIISLGQWKGVVDANDAPGVQKLWLATLLSIIGSVLCWIPLIGGIIGGLVSIVGLVFYIMGTSALKNSTTLPANGVAGAKKLHTAIILSIIASVLAIIPFINIIGAILSIVAWVLQLVAWKKIATA